MPGSSGSLTPEIPADAVRPPRSLPAARREAGLSRRAVARQAWATFGGRALLSGLVSKILVLLARAAGAAGGSLLTVVDTAGSVAVALGGAYFLWLGVSAARRRLLWRVRRKLVISYIFIGFIPALLIVIFFLLGGFMLFSNVSAYLVQNRLREMGERTLALADATALEARLADGPAVTSILTRRQATLARETPAASLVLIPMDAACGDIAARRGSRPRPRPLPTLSAGPWAHLDPPRDIPSWIPCEGFAGVIPYRVATAAAGGDVRLVVRAVALPQDVASGYAAVIDIPVDGAIQTKLREDTSVDLTEVQVVAGGDDTLRGRAAGAPPLPIDNLRPGPQLAVSFLPHRDWATGATGTLQIFMQLNIRQLSARLVAAQGSVSGVSLGGVYLFLLLGVGALFLFIQAVAIFMGMTLARSITGSVHELFAGTIRVQQGDFAHRIAVTARDQLGALAESFNSMTGSIERLLLDANEKKRLEEELRIAHEIQMSLLPQAPAAIPGLSITALCVPAREVGGDYYDFLPLDDGRLGVLIADVAGKGTSAALYMAELKGLMLSLSQTYRSPRALLVTANRLIAAHLDARSFITMTYAVIDPRRRTLTYARAGHTPLLYVPAADATGARHVRSLAPDGLVLGLKIDDGTLFERLLQEQTIPLHTGDVCLLFTDGMTEAMNPQDDCFGEHRLGRIIEEHAHLPCGELRERMLREIAAFVGDAPQHDDMTMILITVDALADAAAEPHARAVADIAAVGAGRP